MDGQNPVKQRYGLWGLSALGLLALVGGVVLYQRPTEPVVAMPPAQAKGEPQVLAPPVLEQKAHAVEKKQAVEPSRAERPLDSIPAKTLEQHHDHDHPDENGLIRPHPITEWHRVAGEQRSLFEGVRQALERRDFQRARELLQRHSTQYADEEDWRDFREGYEAVADCLEHPGAESRARGERFIESNGGSTLRRQVRRACLGHRLN